MVQTLHNMLTFELLVWVDSHPNYKPSDWFFAGRCIIECSVLQMEVNVGIHLPASFPASLNGRYRCQGVF